MPDKNVFCDLGPVSAYALAKTHGYSGTEEQWAQEQAQAGNYAREAKEARTGAETAKTQTEALVKNAEQSVNRAKGEADRADAAANRAECRIENTTVAPDKAWASKETVDRLCTPFVKKAPIVQGAFVPGYPMGVKSYIEPVQEGEGEPSPQNVRPIRGVTEMKAVRCGQNLAPRFTSGTNKNVVFEVAEDGTVTANGTAEGGNASIIVFTNIDLGDQPAFLSGSSGGKYAIEAKIMKDGVTSYARDFGSGARIDGGKIVFIMCVVSNGAEAQNVKYKPMVTVGSGAMPYEPYSGKTFTQQLPQEIFGGTYQWDTGELISELGKLEISHLQKGANSNPEYVRLFHLSTGNPDKRVALSDMLPVQSGTAYSGKSQGIYEPDDTKIAADLLLLVDNIVPYGAVKDNPETYLPAAQKYLAAIGAVLYGWTAPTTIQLQKHLIPAQEGITTVYSSGETEVTARKDPNTERREMQKRLAALEAAHTPTL